jgi:hypothetical protein
VRVGYCHYRWEVYPPEDERSDRALGLGSLMMRLLELWVRANASRALLQTRRH